MSAFPSSNLHLNGPRLNLCFPWNQNKPKWLWEGHSVAVQCWDSNSYILVFNQSSFCLWSSQMSFQPQWVVPAVNCRHKWSHLAECLIAKSNQESKLNVQMLHGCMSLHAHLIHVHTHVQECRCNNSGVLKSLVMNCSEMPWTESLFFSYLTCFYQQPRIYLSISVVPCLCGNT